MLSLCRMYLKKIRASAICAMILLAQAFAGAVQAASMQVVAAQYRADVPFPEFEALWRKASAAAATNLTTALSGGAIHVYLRNTNSGPAVIEDVLLEGISLTQAIANTTERKFKKHLLASSLYFSKLSPAQRKQIVDVGEPVWWRASPKVVEPGAVAEVLIRLRKDPPGANLNCIVKLADGSSQTIAVPAANVAGRCSDVCFSPDLGTAWIYFAAGEKGAAPSRILLDGQDITASCQIGRDPQLNLSPVVFHPPKAFAPASLHCFQAVYEGGGTALAMSRAFPLEFVYGLWGARRGQDNDMAVGRAFVQEIVAHNVNLQMPGIGSPAVAGFYKSDEGYALLRKLGVQRVVDQEGKAGPDRPYAYYLADEPDAADSRVPGAPGGKQIGCLAQGLAAWGEELRQDDPLTPNMLNVDSTFAPMNWRTYGQLPDIFAADPYYQSRQREAYARSPQRVALFEKATYVYAVSSICKASSYPRPLHIMLYGNRYEKGADKFRGPTPPEKRIEAFYAVAAGAKGLSYWWYSPSKPAVGLGAAEPSARALWREVGLIGAELRTAGPLITRSTPVSLPVTASPKLWVRTLAAGLDSLLLVVVNDDYRNDREGTKISPLPNSSVRLALPGWMDAKDAFEVVSQGTKEVARSLKDGELELNLGTVNVTRLVVITADPALRGRLQQGYDERYAANVKRLLGP